MRSIALLSVTLGATLSACGAELQIDERASRAWYDSHFVMTNWFYNYEWKNPEKQIRLLKERGYDGVMLSLKDDPDRWAMLPRYLDALASHGMHLDAIHARFYLEDGSYPQVIKDHLPLLRDTGVILVPSVGTRGRSDQAARHDPELVAACITTLREMADDARAFGLGGVAPYMHINNWIESLDDNLRIANAVDRRNVGVMFHLHHWTAIAKRQHDAVAPDQPYRVDQHALARDIRRAYPYLMIVVIQGQDNDAATHKIVGEGSFDMVPLVQTLHEIGYRGPLGTMGFTQQGDIPGKLTKAMGAWQKIRQEVVGDTEGRNQ